MPIDGLRFASAKPIQTIDDCWNGTFIAHNSTPPCLQYDTVSKNITGVENCLTLDIITPEVFCFVLLCFFFFSSFLAHFSKKRRYCPGFVGPSVCHAYISANNELFKKTVC